MKKKYLTPLYLAMMHAFADTARAAEESPYLSLPQVIEEYRTLRLDGGRQTGKTQAIVQFCSEWIADGNSVLVVGRKLSAAKEVKERIERWYKATSYRSIDGYDPDVIKHNVDITWLRDFMNPLNNRCRGKSFPSQMLVVFDEVIDFPKYHEAAEVYCKTYRISNHMRNDPLFFVIGM